MPSPAPSVSGSPVDPIGASLLDYDPVLKAMVGGTAESPGSPVVVPFPQIAAVVSGFISTDLLDNQAEAYKTWTRTVDGKRGVSIMPIQTVGQLPYGMLSGGPEVRPKI